MFDVTLSDLVGGFPTGPAIRISALCDMVENCIKRSIAGIVAGIIANFAGR